MYKTQSSERQGRSAAAPGMVTPALPFAAAAYLDGANRLSSEWLDFVHRRLNADIHLSQRLLASKSSNDVWKAYFEFWQLAAEDYWKENVLMTKLIGEIQHTRPDAAATPTEEPARNSPLHHAA